MADHPSFPSAEPMSVEPGGQSCLAGFTVAKGPAVAEGKPIRMGSFSPVGVEGAGGVISERNLGRGVGTHFGRAGFGDGDGFGDEGGEIFLGEYGNGRLGDAPGRSHLGP